MGQDYWVTYFTKGEFVIQLMIKALQYPQEYEKKSRWRKKLDYRGALNLKIKIGNHRKAKWWQSFNINSSLDLFSSWSLKKKIYADNSQEMSLWDSAQNLITGNHSTI